MKKLKVYLDTSVISHLDHPDAPENMQQTLKFWDELVKGLYWVFISEIVLLEINKCPEHKRLKMLEYINSIRYDEIIIDNEIIELARKYVSEGIIPGKYIDDALHIAAATVADCDILASWNFKHIVRSKTIFGVNGVNRLFGYKEIQLLTPGIIIGEEG
ncbi:MAG TPA: type II toxin-antitoxin system VapC family toxin [Thermoanaerobacterales bacterium]|nr:type II toxin-antitoxin system VapC family toxin [Thermoanaerobacterales bacterium]